jgi:2-C-methyl-D-erythritol 4-phosphate cytidylyltransferase
MKKYAIIVAGGSGSRMSSAVPKQFMLLAGKPVLMHTVQKFFDADERIKIIVVLPEKEISRWKTFCDEYSFAVKHETVSGGVSRFQSVRNGLQKVTEKSIVAIHDGVRPFTSINLIRKCFDEASRLGNAVPGIPLNESIRKINGNQNESADRNSFVLIQTPQCFDSEQLKKAYASDEKNSFTDDATVMEQSGGSIHLIEGEKENIKITFPHDLIIGDALLKNRNRPD